VRVYITLLLLTLAFAATACAASSTPISQPALPPVQTAAPPTAPPQNTAIFGDTVKLAMVAGKNEARYRVREQLSGVPLPNDAVGSTREISGTIVGKLDGSIVSSQSKFSVDMRTLKSDQIMRDNFLQRSVIQSDRYPYATFVQTQAPGLPLTLPVSGDVRFKLIGDLTIRDVTKSVTWDAQGKVTDDEAIGTAKTNFNFAYFNLTIPNVARVLSIVDNIQLELDLKRAR
jgi:polyisoprenoid-binding protein YceI